MSNEDCKSSTDADARIAHMKDGTTHLAYKAEHVVDLESDLVLAAEVRLATDGDAATMAGSLLAAQENLELCGSAAVIEEVAADKGYHSGQALETCTDFGWRTYIPEPRRRHPVQLSNRSEAQRRAVLNNRSRTRRSKSKRLQRRRSEVVERTFAHVCETGGGRRSHLRGLVSATKRYLLAVAAHNLGRILRTLTGIGKPRSLQGVGGALLRRGRRLWCRVAGWGRRWRDWVRGSGHGRIRHAA